MDVVAHTVSDCTIARHGMVEGADRVRPGSKDMIAEETMMGRIAEPSEIVGPLLFLASDASSFVTGDDISVSGGMMK